MADPIHFPGANHVFRAPAGRDDIGDLHTFRAPHGPANVSCWRLTAEELAEVNRTGNVFLCVLSGAVLYPCFVGSEATTRMVAVDFGPVWERQP